MYSKPKIPDRNHFLNTSSKSSKLKQKIIQRQWIIHCLSSQRFLLNTYIYVWCLLITECRSLNTQASSKIQTFFYTTTLQQSDSELTRDLLWAAKGGGYCLDWNIIGRCRNEPDTMLFSFNMQGRYLIGWKLRIMSGNPTQTETFGVYQESKSHKHFNSWIPSMSFSF